MTSISVNASVAGRPFQPPGAAYGNWNFNKIAYGKAYIGEIPNLAQALVALGVNLIRYAGGNWTGYVGFSPTIADQGTPHVDWTYNGHTYQFRYGTDEITDLHNFAVSVGAVVMIECNIRQNDPTMWAGLAQYVKDHNLYTIKWYELGNEIDLGWSQNDHYCTPAQYYTIVQNYAAAIRAVDPAAQIIVGVPATASDDFYSFSKDKPSEYITQGVAGLHDAGHNAESTSYHWYQGGSSNVPSDYLRFGNWYDITSPIYGSNQYGRDWSGQAAPWIRSKSLGSSSSTKIGVSEFAPDSANGIACNSNFVAALWYSDVVGRMNRDGVAWSTQYLNFGAQAEYYAPIYQNLNDTTDNHTPIQLRPNYYGLVMWKKWFGTQMVQATSDDEPSLSVYASTDPAQPGKLFLRINNMTAGAITAPVSISGYSGASAVKYVLTSSNPLDTALTSCVEGANGVNINGATLNATTVAASLNAITGAPVTLTTGNSFTATYPAYSSTAIILSGSAVDLGPDPTPVIVDPFTGTAGAAFDSTKWNPPTTSGAASALLASGGAALSVTGTNYSSVGVLWKMADLADQDWEIPVTMGSTNEQYFELFARCSVATGGNGGTATEPLTGYMASIEVAAGTLHLWKYNGDGTRTSLGSAFLAGTTMQQYLRLQVIGSTVKCRTRLATSPEPHGIWDITFPDPSPITTGRMAIAAFSGYTTPASVTLANIEQANPAVIMTGAWGGLTATATATVTKVVTVNQTWGGLAGNMSAGNGGSPSTVAATFLGGWGGLQSSFRAQIAMRLIGVAGVGSTDTITKPAGAVTGDYYVVHVYSESTTAVTHAITGFTSAGTSAADVNGHAHVSMHWRAYDGTEGASFQVTGYTAGVYVQMVTYIVRASVTGGPAISGVPSADTGVNQVIPAISPTVAGALVVADEFQTAALAAPPVLTGTGTWVNQISQQGFSGNVWTQTFAVAGSTGTLTVQKSTTAASTASGGHLVAWNPDAATTAWSTATTWGGLSGAMAADLSHGWSVNQVWGALTATMAADVTVPVTVAATWGGLSGAMAAGVVQLITVSQVWGGLVGAMTATVSTSVPGSVTITITGGVGPSLTLSRNG